MLLFPEQLLQLPPRSPGLNRAKTAIVATFPLLFPSLRAEQDKALCLVPDAARASAVPFTFQIDHPKYPYLFRTRHGRFIHFPVPRGGSSPKILKRRHKKSAIVGGFTGVEAKGAPGKFVSFREKGVLLIYVGIVTVTWRFRGHRQFARGRPLKLKYAGTTCPNFR